MQNGRDSPSILEDLSMKWWRDEMKKDDPFGIPVAFVLIAVLVAVTLIPLVLIAVGMSFIVPVEPWVAVLAVLAGWPIQWRLMIGYVWPFAVRVGAGAAWVFGAFAAGHLLGSIPAIVVIIAASPNTIWVIGRLEDFNEAAEGAAYDAFVDALHGRQRPPP